MFWFVGRTGVGPTSWMSACWCDQRTLTECTDRIGNWELDHGDIVDEEADLIVHPVHHIQPVQLPMHDFRHMIGMVCAVPAWQPRKELPVVCQWDNADRKRAARSSSQYKCGWAPVPEHEQRPRWGIDGWFAVVGAGRNRHPKCKCKCKCNWYYLMARPSR